MSALFGESLLNACAFTTCRSTSFPFLGLPVAEAPATSGAFGGTVTICPAFRLPFHTRLVTFIGSKRLADRRCK
ncbi:MAG: hypothetical protein EBZ88_03575 [Actinobacteria bacterium]|nr:hypothetical protein [Actinomycetota bacterium]NDC11519.1 hypothetical protein [Actinomycetota bacterium]